MVQAVSMQLMLSYFILELMSHERLSLLLFSQKRDGVKTQEKVEFVTRAKSTSAKTLVPERARKPRSSSTGHSSSEDDSASKGASSTAGTKKCSFPVL